MKKLIGLFLIGILFFIFPIQAFAADFTIDESEIHAYLQEDGTVQVEESYTYTFEDDFNGITRSIIPKEGTAITDFDAMEDGISLEVEQEDELYRVYRSGDDETITIELSYLIHDGIEVYEDMAQFYWPFFDSSNEADYENMTISIYPPEATDDVIGYGFDEARGTENIGDDGVVTFQMESVDSGKDGDIRVAYDQALFSEVIATNSGTLRGEMVREQEELAEQQANFLNRQQTLNNLAPIIIGVFGLLFIGLLFYAWRKKRRADHEADCIYYSHSIVPREILSMPATIYYYRSYIIGYGEMLTIGMMDLLRKGNIETIEEDSYRLINEKTNFEHETKLIQLLFKTIGKDDMFSFEQLDTYTNDQKNNSTFSSALHEYLAEVMEEIKTHHLYNKHKSLRWTVGLSSLLLIPAMILFGMHDLFMWVFFSIIIMFGLLFFSFVFSTKTPEAKVIKKRWKEFEEEYAELPEDKWVNLPEKEKERALIFSAGAKNEKVKERSSRMMENYNNSNDNSVYIMLMLFTLSSIGNNRFDKAATVAAGAGTSSSSSYSGAGTGVGGGGGGSGGF